MVRVPVKDETGEVLRAEGQGNDESLNTEGEKNDLGNTKDPGFEGLSSEELIQKVQALQSLADKNFDLYVRAQAEMDNMKKRFQREREDWMRFSNEALMRQLLPSVDNLEKAIAHANSGQSTSHAVAQGLELTLKGLWDPLEKAGLERLKAVGAPFDPNVHEAVSTQVNESVKPGTVLQELQKGYLLNRRLIRPALVLVSQKANDE